MIKKYSEINKKYYHGSSKELPVGTILKPRGEAYEKEWEHTDFYSVLERYRPKNMLAHKNSVFMCDNPDDVDLAGGATDYLFTVVPLGKIEKHDLNWGSEISFLIQENPEEGKLKELAENYWNGTPHSSGESLWEYLTPSAKILNVEEY